MRDHTLNPLGYNFGVMVGIAGRPATSVTEDELGPARVRDRYGEVVFDYSMPDGTDSREGSTVGYQCVGCGQKVADLLAHNTAFHSREAQETNMQLAGLTPLREQRR